MYECAAVDDQCERAWAAGFFDAEGSTSADRGTRHVRVHLSLTQAGDSVPPELERFGRAVNVQKRIYGPFRSRLYHWTISDHAAVIAVGSRLWPWLGERKRAQFSRALELASLSPQRRARFEHFAVAHDDHWREGAFEAIERLSSLRGQQDSFLGRAASSCVRTHWVGQIIFTAHSARRKRHTIDSRRRLSFGCALRSAESAVCGDHSLPRAHGPDTISSSGLPAPATTSSRASMR